jgi:hypothetical protein
VSARVCSISLYSILLSLYPAELRNRFGAEMTQVFLEDLDESYAARGFFGASGVWFRSLKELLRIALPACAARREVTVAFITYILMEIYLGGIMLLARGDPRAVLPKSMEQMIVLGLVAGLVPASIAFIALRTSNRSVPVPLNLSSK